MGNLSNGETFLWDTRYKVIKKELGNNHAIYVNYLWNDNQIYMTYQSVWYNELIIIEYLFK